MKYLIVNKCGRTRVTNTFCFHSNIKRHYLFMSLQMNILINFILIARQRFPLKCRKPIFRFLLIICFFPRVNLSFIASHPYSISVDLHLHIPKYIYVAIINIIFNFLLNEISVEETGKNSIIEQVHTIFLVFLPFSHLTAAFTDKLASHL